MKSGSHSHKAMNYESLITKESCAVPGVRFRIRRLSLSRRMDLVRRIREAGEGLAFYEAGETVSERARTAEIRARIDAIYVQWGLESVEGLSIDGIPACPQSLLDRGPLALATEIAEAIREELFLNENDRKN